MEGRDEPGGPPGGPEEAWVPFQMFGTSLEALPEVQDGSGGLPEGPGRGSSLFWMAGTGRQALLDVCDRSGGPCRDTGGVGDPFRGPGGFVRPSWRSRRGREAIPEVRKTSAVWEWLGDPLGGPVRVSRPSRRSGTGCEAFLVVKELWKKLLEVQRCREALPKVRDWWRGPP